MFEAEPPPRREPFTWGAPTVDEIGMLENDLRRNSRLRIAAMAAMQTKGKLNPNDQALGSVVDVSRSGIGLETGQPPMVGQQVFLRIALDDEIHEVRARTTRVDRLRGQCFFMVGLDWSDCSELELRFLDRVFEAAKTPAV